jgi:hypothetical protein
MADEYYAEVTGYSNVLLDYYVEAKDSKGNVKKSPIQHVWVADGEPAPSGPFTATPDPAIPGEELAIIYDAVAGSLPDDAQGVTFHWGYDDWNGITDAPMAPTGSDGSSFRVTIQVPAEARESVDFVFTDGTRWDNNNGADYHVAVDPDGETPCEGLCCGDLARSRAPWVFLGPAPLALLPMIAPWRRCRAR